MSEATPGVGGGGSGGAKQRGAGEDKAETDAFGTSSGSGRVHEVESGRKCVIRRSYRGTDGWIRS